MKVLLTAWVTPVGWLFLRTKKVLSKCTLTKLLRVEGNGGLLNFI